MRLGSNGRQLRKSFDRKTAKGNHSADGRQKRVNRSSRIVSHMAPTTRTVSAPIRDFANL